MIKKQATGAMAINSILVISCHGWPMSFILRKRDTSVSSFCAILVDKNLLPF